MKLVSIHPSKAFSLPGLRLQALASITVGVGVLADWRIHVRGPAVFFESPPGWTPSGPKAAPDTRIVFEIPRDIFSLTWQLENGELVEDSGKGFATFSPLIAASPEVIAKLEKFSESAIRDSENSSGSPPGVLEVLPDGAAKQLALSPEDVKEALAIGARERAQAERPASFVPPVDGSLFEKLDKTAAAIIENGAAEIERALFTSPEGPFDDRPAPPAEPVPELEAIDAERRAESTPTVIRRKVR